MATLTFSKMVRDYENRRQKAQEAADKQEEREFHMRMAAERHKQSMRAENERRENEKLERERRQEEDKRKQAEFALKMEDRQIKLGEQRKKAEKAQGDENLKSFNRLLFKEFGSLDAKQKEVLPLEIRKRAVDMESMARQDPVLAAKTLTANIQTEKKIMSDWQKAGLPAAIEERERVLAAQGKKMTTQEAEELRNLKPEIAKQLMGEMAERRAAEGRITPQLQAQWAKENDAVQRELALQKPLEQEFAALTAKQGSIPEEQFQQEFKDLRAKAVAMREASQPTVLGTPEGGGMGTDLGAGVEMARSAAATSAATAGTALGNVQQLVPDASTGGPRAGTGLVDTIRTAAANVDTAMKGRPSWLPGGGEPTPRRAGSDPFAEMAVAGAPTAPTMSPLDVAQQAIRTKVDWGQPQQPGSLREQFPATAPTSRAPAILTNPFADLVGRVGKALSSYQDTNSAWTWEGKESPSPAPAKPDEDLFRREVD